MCVFNIHNLMYTYVSSYILNIYTYNFSNIFVLSFLNKCWVLGFRLLDSMNYKEQRNHKYYPRACRLKKFSYTPEFYAKIPLLPAPKKTVKSWSLSKLLLAQFYCCAAIVLVFNFSNNLQLLPSRDWKRRKCPLLIYKKAIFILTQLTKINWEHIKII